MNHKEVEFKFTIDPRKIVLLSKHEIFKKYTVKKPKTKSTKTIYFDTMNEDIRKKGYMLRIRQFNSHNVQTLKRRASKTIRGLHSNIEWEHKLSKPILNISLFPKKVIKEFKPFLSKIQPIFRSEFKRKTWEIVLEGKTYVEVALDRGQIVAGKHFLPICELELELKRGNIETVKKVASKLKKDIGLKPEPRTKCNRGYTLRKVCEISSDQK